MLYVVPNPDAGMFKCLSGESVYRPLDWRWQRAGYLVHQEIDPKCEDHWVQDCCRAQLALQAAAAQDEKEYRRRKYDPLILDAHEFAESYMSTSRLKVDAGILLGHSSEQIAEECSCAVDLIDAYEAIFFNVRDRLDARDWILSRAVDLRPGQRIGDGGIRQVIRFIAYYFGPVLLDIFLTACRHMQPSPNRLPLLDVVLGIDSPLPAMFKLYLRTQVAELSPLGMFRLQRMNAKMFRRNDKPTIDDFLGPDQLQLRAALNSLPAFARADVDSNPQHDQAHRNGLRELDPFSKPAVALVPTFFKTKDISAFVDPLLPGLAMSAAA